MYLNANVAYINNIIKDYEYKALSSFTKERVDKLRYSNSYEEPDDLTYQAICFFGSFIPGVSSLFDVLGDTQPAYAADLSSLAIEKMSNPQYMAIITRAITENVNIKHTIYTLDDAITEEVRYVRRTRNPAARELAHSLSTDKGMLKFKPVAGWTDLSYNEARAAEQLLFEKYGGLDKLKNKISPMSAKKFSKYVDYAIDVMKKLK